MPGLSCCALLHSRWSRFALNALLRVADELDEPLIKRWRRATAREQACRGVQEAMWRRMLDEASSRL